MMNDNVKNVLKKGIWNLATCADNEPNVVPVGFKDVTDDGKLVVGAVFLEATINNVKANNGKIAIAAFDPETMEAYQVQGTAEYVTEGPVVDSFKAMADETFKGAMTAKGALIITPEKIIVATPGEDNKKVL